MASYTTNLNLKKPAGSENVSIGDINNNMDAIDSAYGTVTSQLSSTTLKRLSNRSDSPTHTYSVPSGSRHFVVAYGGGSARYWAGFVYVSSTGNVTPMEVSKGSQISSVTGGSSNSLVFALDQANQFRLVDIAIHGDFITDA